MLTLVAVLEAAVLLVGVPLAADCCFHILDCNNHNQPWVDVEVLVEWVEGDILVVALKSHHLDMKSFHGYGVSSPFLNTLSRLKCKSSAEKFYLLHESTSVCRKVSATDILTF